jgi:hypothetical protein
MENQRSLEFESHMPCCNHTASYSPATIAKGVVGLSKVLLHIGIADKDTIRARRDICRQCEHASRNKDPKYANHNGLTNFSKCDACLCFVEAKTQLKEEECPLNLW